MWICVFCWFEISFTCWLWLADREHLWEMTNQWALSIKTRKKLQSRASWWVCGLSSVWIFWVFMAKFPSTSCFCCFFSFSVCCSTEQHEEKTRPHVFTSCWVKTWGRASAAETRRSLITWTPQFSCLKPLFHFFLFPDFWHRKQDYHFRNVATL